jgi:hypothetical protein
MIAHIVLFTPKADLADLERRAFASALAVALDGIASVRRTLVGRSVDIGSGYLSVMGGQPYEYAAVIEFDDQDGLKAYLNHPLHVELGRQFWHCCARTQIVDVTFELGSRGVEQLLSGERPT